jgi:hypothetical protein
METFTRITYICTYVHTYIFPKGMIYILPKTFSKLDARELGETQWLKSAKIVFVQTRIASLEPFKYGNYFYEAETPTVSTDENRMILNQGDQVGRIFVLRVIVYFGHFWKLQKSHNIIGLLFSSLQIVGTYINVDKKMDGFYFGQFLANTYVWSPCSELDHLI